MNLKMIEKHFQSNKIIPFKNFEYLLNVYAKIYKGLVPEDDWVSSECGKVMWNPNACIVRFDD